MRKYFTLVSDYIPESGKEELGPYLISQGIVFTLGADFNEELKPFGYVPLSKDKDLKKVYTVLIEEHELTAIMLSVGGVQIIRNRNSINRLNKIRSMFSWILK